ncbi:MAG: membrane protein of unknown function [Candidatus Thorarchaeota archaeon]|nr:MAG: membrane protein of unknown function [Candidatus Thorarchaeota archaeon]
MVTIQSELLSPDDLVLFGVESLIAIGVFIAIVIAILIHMRYPTLTSKGWRTIIIGMVFILLHSIFDAIDTLQFDELTIEILNLLDGSTFVVGLILFAFGIYNIAEYGAEQWGL